MIVGSCISLMSVRLDTPGAPQYVCYMYKKVYTTILGLHT